MRILSVNNFLDEALRGMGHEVVSIFLDKPHVYALRSLVDVDTVKPDIFLQKEYLGAKVLFNDLDTLSCVKGFWSIDTHLNYYWQRYYGLLFDVFFTPHASYISCLADSWLPSLMQRLPQPGISRTWIPFAQRQHAGCFVGRQTAFRQMRTRLCAILKERYGMGVHESLSFGQMLNLYDQTRLLPNECIAFESNFRLMEGASCGCCLLSPEIGEDQDALLTPGEELVVYRDGAELMSLLDYYLEHPQLAEKIGLAAQHRVQAEHLPEHRARVVLETLSRAPRVALRGTAASDALTMTVGMLCMNDLVAAESVEPLLRLPAANAADVLRLRLLLTMKKNACDAVPEILDRAEQLLLCAEHTESTQALAVACGGASIFRKNPQKAQIFYALYENSSPDCTVKNAELLSITELWIDALIRDKKLITHSLTYRDGCCECALDMIQLLASLAPLDDIWARYMHNLEPVRKTIPHFDMAALARLSLVHSDSVELSLDYIATALKNIDFATAEQEKSNLFSLARNPSMKKSLATLLRTRFPYWNI